ncbi:MAG: agmatinase [Candidatus Altiarchaeota archaeon]
MDSLHLDKNMRLEGNAALNDARHAILGVPADYTQTNRVGARYAPLEIRKNFLELDKEWDRISYYDLGNVWPVLGDMKATCGRVAEVLTQLKSESHATPIILGGEHTITYGAVKALQPEVVVWFDAHADLNDKYLGQPFCHATVARRIMELGVKLVQVGVRTKSFEEKEYSEKERVIQVSAEDAKPVLKKLKGKRVYVSVDLDVLDPSIVPGVGNPEPDGISLNTLLSLIDTLREACKPVGFDIVEACPNFDQGLACLSAAAILKSILK